ncbi:MAG: thiamine-phosphate kinase [Chloroflexota bacterium]|nr:thiamine-phosphate kinase [Chloroflexota bacterium]
MDVSDLGEFGLIERLRAAIPASSDERLVLGIGDDAAAWRSADGYTLATTDTMVAGVHFLPGRVRWRDVGWKALAVNISDIATMGGVPSFALVTLVVPKDMAVDALDELYSGLSECAAVYGVSIVGGDIVSAPAFAITVALMGAASAAPDGSPLLLRRDAAQAGDAIAVTGPLGASAGGLQLLLEGDAPAGDPLVARHMRPRPRVEAGHAAVAAGVRCAIDVSDGLAQDLGHICDASGVDAQIRVPRVPVDAATASRFPADALTMALTGGEDYELILVGSEARLRATEAALGAPITIIGQMVRGGGAVHLLDADGREVSVASDGWDHLAPGRRV